MTPVTVNTCRELPALLMGTGADLAAGLPNIDIAGLCLDSRNVQPGELFVALRGGSHDGRAYLSQAAAAGAVAALVEDELPGEEPPLPCVVIPGLRHKLCEIAGRYYRDPSRQMHVAAVTGTNGKTTVSQLFAQLLRSAGYDCGVIGTLGASLTAGVQDSVHTTPDSIAMQEILASWAGQAVPFVSMEVSSHALDQGRVNGLDIDSAIFTNLTRDHLDYHGDMESYGAAKARLFAFESLRTAILNSDDPFSDVLAGRMSLGVAVLRYGLNDASADVRLSNLRLHSAGMQMRLESPWGNGTLNCPLLGKFNAVNLLAALTAALQAGVPFDAVMTAAESLQPVPGRMEPIHSAAGPLVVVDYAHTPDALRHVLIALREQCKGRLIAVFGCGGDRDKGKRPLMAEAVAAIADRAVITSDNPRSEDPLAIIADIEAAMAGEYHVCADRGDAIAMAIESAAPEDCVLIAGKGHEDYQIIGDQRFTFSDSAVAQQVLARSAA
ncbi:UDP-N-acetylmuramoyl-L-alanyl-D-glutamate--2,6-diaminopimelate ligase [Congregibacter litoralis]|uniref:UDP-N-acetylmuramoyl-L-alanyl-D-glutamate--2,6-diaminopimelate ligase n=1 Tax=Congregibacter litoralis KT71 TaxID=314285 RepID=A4A5F5_9GAMM|nr:UDP-N-acetylmuramoyl-L-alanyl-D-glutamate--2,6-diaminopimelate ligase [Congregibacter litoralis]EAQ99026.1 UDP-N-acetylmuramoylalanyl-D-glutamate--2,6-diaminopimelate ligase [Congregibacter litoralis KT71]